MAKRKARVKKRGRWNGETGDAGMPMVMACRTLLPPEDPALRAAYDKLAPLDPGWEASTCPKCGVAIAIGVRQLAQLHDNPDLFQVLCIMCAVRVAYEMRTVMDTFHLGGR